MAPAPPPPLLFGLAAALAACGATHAAAPETVFAMAAFPVEVRENRFEAAIGDWTLPQQAGEQPSHPSLAAAVANVPGVGMQQRGHNALEPSLRGLSLDRVQTTLNGIHLPNAAPTRTAAPVNFLSAQGADSVRLSAGFPSVTGGPVPTGGRIEIQAGAGSRSGAVALLQSNPEGAGARVAWTAGNEARTRRAGLAAHGFCNSDYQTGGNPRDVDADYRAWGLQAGLDVLQPGDRHLLVTARYFRQDLVRNASLPLDTRDTDALFLTSAYTAPLAGGTLLLKLGYAEILPFMTSADRPVADAFPMRLIEAAGKAASVTMGAGYTRPPLREATLTAGFDATWQNRDATRQRHLRSGETLEDRLWPDIRLRQPGLFLEAASLPDQPLYWRAGGRIEATSMAADGGNPPQPSEPDWRDWTGALNLLTGLELGQGWSLQAGAGATRAAPGPNECYRGFVSALGGGTEVGNPELAVESKYAGSIGLRREGPAFSLSVEAWLARIDGFIQREAISLQPLVYSWRNRGARFEGLDLALQLRPVARFREYLSLEAALSVTHGEDRDTGQGLPEIPPWDARLGARWTGRSALGSWGLGLESRLAGAGRNPQPGLNPLYADTPSWVVWNLSLVLSTSSRWTLSISVDNLFDQLGYAYLQAPVDTGAIGPSSGDLLPGDRIPFPGRGCQLGLGRTF